MYEGTPFFHCRKQTDEEASCLSKQAEKKKISLLFIQEELDQKVSSSMPVAELQSQLL